MEVDKISTLTRQMKEDSQKELAAALNENSLLTQELNQLKIDVEQKVQLLCMIACFTCLCL